MRGGLVYIYIYIYIYYIQGKLPCTSLLLQLFQHASFGGDVLPPYSEVDAQGRGRGGGGGGGGTQGDRLNALKRERAQRHTKIHIPSSDR